MKAPTPYRRQPVVPQMSAIDHQHWQSPAFGSGARQILPSPRLPHDSVHSDLYDRLGCHRDYDSYKTALNMGCRKGHLPCEAL